MIHICTAPETHGSLTRLAIEHGTHVYVGKPLASTRAEAQSILTLARKKGVQVYAGHQLLFESPALRAKEALSLIGASVHIDSYFSFR